MKRAFGGSLDKAKSLEEIVIDEVIEEAGYIIDEDDIFSLGKVFVSTQMNQFVHLFLSNIPFLGHSYYLGWITLGLLL